MGEVADEIAAFAGLKEGWDGESAARPSKQSISTAVLFCHLREDLMPACCPTLHVDGTVILEGDDWSIRFLENGRTLIAGEVPSLTQEPTP